MARKLRMGMVGGGPDAFIGDVHRKAARMDGKIELVSGMFSRTAEKSAQAGTAQFIDPSRVHSNIDAYIAAELALPADERIDFVCICTPNSSHFSAAKAFLDAGFHVMCDKPLTTDLATAKEFRDVVAKSGLLFGLTHNYTGYPMVKLARDMVAAGDLGDVRKIVVKYPQGWLASAIDAEGQKQAEWRTDPAIAGASSCMGDIGTHAENLAEYITGLKMVRICADLNAIVPGRRLDDDGNCLVHWENGVKGLLFASQISVGEENGLAINIYGTKSAIEWHQEHPNWLHQHFPDQPSKVWKRGNDYIGAKSPAAGRATRIPFGHPEAFLEAFANLYVNYAEALNARLDGVDPDPLALDFPGIEDGVRGVAFIEACVESAKNGATWVDFPTC